MTSASQVQDGTEDHQIQVWRASGLSELISSPQDLEAKPVLVTIWSQVAQAMCELASTSLSVSLSWFSTRLSPHGREGWTDGRDCGQFKHVILPLVLLAQVKPPSPWLLTSFGVNI